MKKYILLIIVLSSLQASAQFNKAGRTALQFLKIGIGAQQVAMGEAAIANVNDINSIFWNPAALTSIPSAEASFHYTKWIGDLNITGGAVGVNLTGIGVIALNYISLDYGDIDEALVTSPTGRLDTRTGNTFSGGDFAFGVGLARQFTDKLSVGINAKYIREDLHTFTSSLWAFDIGTFYHTGWKGIRLAMSAQNFSSQARWMFNLEENQQSYELPLVFRIGWAIDLLGGDELFLGGNPLMHKFTLSMDALHTNDYSERLHVGGEYMFYNMFALRGGYKFNYEEGNLSFGAGFNYMLGMLNLKFDYAYVDYDFLQSPHRFSISLAF